MFTWCALLIINIHALDKLPPGGESILAENWFEQITKQKNGADFSIRTSSNKNISKIIHVVTKQTKTFRKPDNYPISLPLTKSKIEPGSTIVVRFFYKGNHTNPSIEAFHTPPVMSTGIKYNSSILLNTGTIGKLELFPFWREFKMSVQIPKSNNTKNKKRGKRRKKNSTGLAVTLFFGYMPESIDVGGISVMLYPPGKLAPDSFVPPIPRGNSLIVFQNHSKSIDVLWNDSHPLKDTLHVSSVIQPKYGKVTFHKSKITYKSTKPHEFGYDYFYYTVSDSKGNKRTAPVKVIVTPDFLDGTWNIGHDFKTFPNDLKTKNGTPITLKRFIPPYAMGIGVGRVIKTLEKMDKEKTLGIPLKLAVFPFAKRGPNGEDVEPSGVYWDLPHSIDTTFCLPIMQSLGGVINPTFKGPHNHDLISFPMQFHVKQLCINSDDEKVRFFFKMRDTYADIGIGYKEFKIPPLGTIKKERRGSSIVVKIGGKLYTTDLNKSKITSKDTNADGYPDIWFDENGTRIKKSVDARITAPVKNREDITVNFDMKDYFDWAEKTGWQHGGYISYLFNGSEMGSEGASKGRMKGAGVMVFDHVKYWLSTDIPAKHPIPDILISKNGAPLKIDLTPVFDKIYEKNLDQTIPKLSYSIAKNTGEKVVKLSISKSTLTISPQKEITGSAEVTIKATDHLWNWDDIEKFKVTVVNKTNIDNDKDGLTDAREMKLGTNPIYPDSDFDGITDYLEITKYKTNPLNPDSDSDGLSDGMEITNKTNIKQKDSDKDGISDGDEVLIYHSNPLKQDSDGDGYPDPQEIASGMDPSKPYAPIAKYNFDSITGIQIKDLTQNNRDLIVHKRQGLKPGIKGKAMFCDGRKTAVPKNSKDLKQKLFRGFTLSIWANPSSKMKRGTLFHAPDFSIVAENGYYVYNGAPPSGTPLRWSGRGPHSLPPIPVSYKIAPLSSGRWSHIVIASNGKNTVMYFNGKKIKEISKLANGGFSNFKIAGGNSKKSAGWQGLIDEVFIDSRMLSQAEILKLK